MDTIKLADINEKVVALIKGIHILPVISWPLSSEKEFLATWDQKNPKFPKIEYPKVSHKDRIDELQKILRSFTAEHPLEQFTQSTIESYITAARMIETVGTLDFQKYSIEIYGQPGDIITGSSLTHTVVAERILHISQTFTHSYIHEPELCELAQTVASFLQENVHQHFGNKGPVVELNNKISAKATAGARSVKIRPAS